MWNAATGVVLIVIGALYTRGLIRLWRSDGGRATVRPWQAAAFAIGWLSVVVALLSRLDVLSDILFSAHMVQHEILMLVAAPLMVLGRPFIVMRLAAVIRLLNRVTGPLFVLVLHAVVLWAWHIPRLFEAALHDDAIHAFQHLGFFVTAALFWYALIHGRYGRVGYGVGVAYVFFTAMHTQVLGALLTFGHRPWYPTHAMRTGAAHALDDQQLAGVVMWIPFGVVFLLIALALFAAWLGEAERRVAFTTAGRLKRVSTTTLMLLLLAGCRGQDDETARQLTGGGDATAGKVAIERYGCGACHEIPGIDGARGMVGPSLRDVADRSYLAGQLPNQSDNMIKWIRDPQTAEPGTAMPDMNVTQTDARNIAAYLYTLRR